MMFGNTKRKSPFGMGGIVAGDGTLPQFPQAEGMGEPGQGFPMPETTQQKRKPNWIGIGADFLAGLAGTGPVYAPMAERQREREGQEAAYQRRRADDYADFERKERFKMANPDPGNPYRFEDNAGNVYERDPVTGQNRLIFTDPNDKVFMQDGQMITVPNRVRTQSPASSGSPPSAAIEALRGNPALKADFEAKYGPGAADRHLGGGGVSNGTGGFPY